MKISLRKASVIQNAINEAVKGITFNTEVKLNEFQDAATELGKAHSVLEKNLARRQSLQRALYEIRGAVSTQNHTVGVDRRLTEIAGIDKEIAFYKDLSVKQVCEAAEVVAGKLGKIRSHQADSRMAVYGYESTVDTSVLTDSDVHGFKQLLSQLKKQKQALQDEVLELNVRTEIEVSTNSVQALQAEGIV